MMQAVSMVERGNLQVKNFGFWGFFGANWCESERIQGRGFIAKKFAQDQFIKIFFAILSIF